MERGVILAIDQGTTGSTALLIDSDLKVLGQVNQEFPQIFPRPGWVEHKGEDIWRSVKEAVTGCLDKAGVNPKQIKAIGIANQRETTCLFDKQGKPFCNFIVWQCRRSAGICEELKQAGFEMKIRQKTGLVLDPYFSATKLMWLFRQQPHLHELAEHGEALFGTIDSWLLYRLTQGATHATDATNASRTLMMNLESCSWDEELLKFFKIPAQILPQIRSNSEIFGQTRGLDFLPDGIPISGLAGDQQAALFGQACFEPGQAKATYGTGCFMLMNTGAQIARSQNGLLSSVAIQLGKEVQYCLEGSAFIAGAAIQWIRDGLGLIKNAAETEPLALAVENSGDVVFVPALSGLGAPYWRPDARGLFCGITRGTKKEHLVRAVLEGIALQNRDILDAMQRDAGVMVQLKVDGGATQNNFLMQYQADVLNVPCVRPEVTETTALGAAALAGLAIGFFKGKGAFQTNWKAEREFVPQRDDLWRKQQIAKWARAVERA